MDTGQLSQCKSLGNLVGGVWGKEDTAYISVFFVYCAEIIEPIQQQARFFPLQPSITHAAVEGPLVAFNIPCKNHLCVQISSSFLQEMKHSG